MEKITHRRKAKSPILKKNQFENSAWERNQLVCGIDEVGRGCLAGPLFAAAVILPPGARYRYLQDSKILTEADRLKAYSWIIKNGWYGIGCVDHRTIDRYNIWQATLIAMRRALLHLLVTREVKLLPEAILIDAMPLNLADTSYSSIPVHYFPKGESLSVSIAAASVVAKVTRDRLMQEAYAPLFPGYGLAQHKGYATPVHRDAVSLHGQSFIHRASFCKNIDSDIEPTGAPGISSVASSGSSLSSPARAGQLVIGG
jgi:ribonuclease HII